MSRINCFIRGLLLTAAVLPAQTQTFSVGQWFAGRNVSSELPADTIDLADSFWASDTYTCPLVMTGSRTAPAIQLMCRAHTASARFETVMAESDARLGNTRLAVPTAAGNEVGRYLTSMVRPGPKHLYFTSFTGTTPQTFSNKIAWRYRDYKTLEKVVAQGDTVTFRGTPHVLTAAGPIDADQNGREFVYLESSFSAFYGIFEIKGPGVYERVYGGVLPMRDTPWGMGGFVFNDYGLVFRQGVSIYHMDPNAIDGRPGIIAQEGDTGQTYMPPTVNFANMDLAQFFRPTNDLTTFFFNWGNVQGNQVPNDFFSEWNDFVFRPYYSNALGTPSASTASVIASGDRVTVMGTGPRGPGTTDYDASSRVNLAWPVSTLWLNRAGTWQRILNENLLPDSGQQSPKKFYQGLTAYRCSAEFATKRNDGSTDNGGTFFGFYRLIRPCIDSATFNTTTRDLTITGINLQDLRTEIGVPQDPTSAGAPLGRLITARIDSLTPTEIKAKVDSVATLDRVSVLLNGTVWSEGAAVKLVTQPAPILANNTDMNFDLSNPSPAKLMTITGVLGCQTATTPTVNYPTTLGNCSVLLDNSIRLPLLYTSDTQINYLLPTDLTVFSHSVRVTRTDANGVFNSEAYLFTSAPHWPVPIKNSGRPIVVVIRNGQVVVLGPSDAVSPGEYFTFYLTGALLPSLPDRAVLNSVEVPYAAAVVNWAQGVVQVNVQAPALTAPNATLTLGPTVSIPISIR